ncbi:MAG: hypothetical protein ACTHMR_02595 [Thermomicrobiales bacterium]
MGVIDAIAEGCFAVARRPIVMAPVVALDLFYWLGARLTIAPLVEALIHSLQSSTGPGVDATTVDALRQYEQTSNLVTLLALGQKPLLPSLLPEQIARPWAQGVFDLDRWWLLLPCIAGLALVGLLVLALPLAALGQVVREEPFSPLHIARQTPRIWLRMLGLLAVILAGLTIVGLPALIVMTLLAVVGINPAPLLLLSVAPLAIIYVYLSLAPEAIAVSDVGPLRAIKLSASVVRRNFWGMLGLLAATLLIGYGFPYGWALLTKYVAGVLLAIVGNGVLATGLLAAGMFYYRERLAALEGKAVGQPDQPAAERRDDKR